ncbi:MAG: hypothetical protein KAH33_04290 [Candidatus Delongbacteria bacterium]|nr:hypothetical protein [Candidatus Delongbacteria bacterium]
MTGKTLFLILLFIFCFTLFSSKKDSLNYSLTSSNNIYLSFAGDGNLAALNYERIFKNTEKLFYTFKIGISYHPDMTTHTDMIYDFEFDRPDDDETGPIITNHLTINYGEKYTFFEVGVGSSVYLLEDNAWNVVYPIIGIRRQSANGSFRIFTHPFSLTNKNVDWIFPVGISFGISF